MRNAVTIFTFWILCSMRVTAQKTTVLRIDPANSSGGTASQVFEEIHYFPLETTIESLFGHIDQLEVTDKYFIVLDKNSTHKLLIFEKSGKLHKVIHLKNNSSITIHYEPASHLIELFKLDNRSQTYSPEIQLYDLDGKQVGTKKVSPYINQSQINYYHFAGNITAYTDYSTNEHLEDSVAYEVFITKNDKFSKGYFPYNQQKDASDDIAGVNHTFYPSDKDTAVFYARPYDYNIYAVTPHELYPRFKFILPLQNSLPENFRNDSGYKGRRVEYLKEHPLAVYSIRNPYLIGHTLLFKLSGGNSYYYASSNQYILDLATNRLIEIGKITPDSSCSFLPVTDLHLGSNFTIDNFKSFDGAYLYSSISSLNFLKAKEQTVSKNPVYPSHLKSYFEKATKWNNPVIIQYKLKERL